jgi:hypothetical protein
MNRTTILSVLLAFGVVAGACSGGTTSSDVASLDNGVGDTKPQNFVPESIPGEEAVLAFHGVSA